MGILNHLFWPIWQAEEQSKQRTYHNRLSAMTMKLAARYLNRDTSLQRKIRRWGGAEDPTPQMSGGPRSQQQAYSQAAQYQQFPHGPAQNGQWNSQALSTAGGFGLVTVGLGGYGGGGGIRTVSVVNSPAHTLGWPYSYELFHIMRGIEERAEGRLHRYDDDASNMTDYRLIDKEVPILWITSFCLANYQDPEMMVLVLEHSGYTVVEGDDD